MRLKKILQRCAVMTVASTALAAGIGAPRLGAQSKTKTEPACCTAKKQTAASKKAAEAVCYSYHHLHGLDISILRYFTVYGPASRPDMSPFRFTQWISEDRPVILYGDGLQQRDFTYVDDIACGTIAALKPLGYATINLGSDSPISMREMIGLVEKNMGQRAHITLKAAHPADVRATWADISRAKELLEWQPQVNYEEGFKRLVRWYVDNRDWASLIDTAELPDKEASATASPVAAHLS